jgi:SAM-dependent methyltransferase
MVGPTGHVFALDVQDPALQQTGQALAAAGLLSRVTLFRGDHSHLPESLPCEARGRLGMVCFNLGYLPGGDHSITTTAASTLAGLRQSLDLIRPGGVLSVVAYRGHPGAEAEAGIVEAFFTRLPNPWRQLLRIETGMADRPGPVLYLAEKMPGPAA